MTFADTVETTGKILDGVGVAVVVIGVLVALVSFGMAALGGAGALDAYRTSRRRLGRAILLGLEVLVAADIIRTVAIAPTIGSVAVLGGIVLVRTFLSFSLEVELEGTLPWRRTRGGQAPEGNNGSEGRRAEPT
ncbi:MAG TPA: DUF1622 domain-containing protein [Actinomycetota bacterium]